MGRSSSFAPTRSAVLACAAFALGGLVQPAVAAVSLSASSTQVSNPGDFGQICVSLVTNGEEVAGTQNDLSWDGACATLDESNCAAIGSHGKQLSGKLIPQRDFVYRALILSLTNVDPMDDGPLYCCRFQAEAEPGQCCDIKMSNAQASTSKGDAIAALTNTAKLCVSSGSGSGGGPVGNVGRSNQPLSASNEGAVGQAPAAQAPAAAPAAGNAAPINQVLQGGGARVPAVPAGVPGDAELPTAEPTPAATPAAPGAAAPGLAVPGVAALATAVAPTAAAPTAAVPVDTPTAEIPPTIAATAVPPTKAVKAAAPAPPAAAQDSGGWFGCQLGGGGLGVVPLAGAGALWVLAAVRRRRRRLTPHSNRNED